MAAPSYGTYQASKAGHAALKKKAAESAGRWGMTSGVLNVGRPSGIIGGALIGGAFGYRAGRKMDKNRKLVQSGVMSPYEADKQNRRARRRGAVGGYMATRIAATAVPAAYNYLSGGATKGVYVPGLLTPTLHHQKGQFSLKTTRLGGTTETRFADTHRRIFTYGTAKKTGITKFPSTVQHWGSHVETPLSVKEHAFNLAGRFNPDLGHNERGSRALTHFHTSQQYHLGVNPYRTSALALGGAAAVGGGVYTYRHRQDIKDFYYRRTKKGKQVRVKKGKRKGRR